jgi:hypothetical protein
MSSHQMAISQTAQKLGIFKETILAEHNLNMSKIQKVC